MELREKAAGQSDAFAPVPAGDPAMRQLYNGAGDGLHRAMEMAIVPALFGAFGYGLDRWLGLLPVLTIAFVVLAVIGLGARMFYTYDARMKQHEAESPWAPSGPRSGMSSAPSGPRSGMSSAPSGPRGPA